MATNTNFFHSSFWEVNSNWMVAALSDLFIWLIECTRRNILGLPSLDHTLTVASSPALLKCSFLGAYSLWEPSWHKVRSWGHTERPRLVLWSKTPNQLSSESQHQLPALWMNHLGHQISRPSRWAEPQLTTVRDCSRDRKSKEVYPILSGFSASIYKYNLFPWY